MSITPLSVSPALLLSSVLPPFLSYRTNGSMDVRSTRVLRREAVVWRGNDMPRCAVEPCPICLSPPSLLLIPLSVCQRMASEHPNSLTLSPFFLYWRQIPFRRMCRPKQLFETCRSECKTRPNIRDPTRCVRTSNDPHALSKMHRRT